jgi:hypothetical protein
VQVLTIRMYTKRKKLKDEASISVIFSQLECKFPI